MFDGPAVRVRYRTGLHDSAGNPAHAATSIPGREITLDPELKTDAREHERILLHEYFHFVWARLGNPKRRAWEAQLAGEWKIRVRGEAGWSAEWRKKELTLHDISARTRRWRDYCCESFCDTGAWWVLNETRSGAVTENTLGRAARHARAAWFTLQFGGRPLRV
jgi:hypothetical protein